MLNLNAQTEEQKKKSSLEVTAQLYGGSAPTGVNSGVLLESVREGGVSFSHRENPEFQIKYTREVVQDVSVYGGLSYGINFFRSSFLIIRGPSSPMPTSSFSNTLFYNNNAYHRVAYTSSHLGVRYTLNIKKNDAFNMSLGWKAIFYPSQNISMTRAGYAPNRFEDFRFTLQPSGSTESNFTTGLEMDFNYQFGFKDSPLNVVVGVTIDRAINKAIEINSQIVYENSALNFKHNLGGGRIGGFIGMAYAIGERNKQFL